MEGLEVEIKEEIRAKKENCFRAVLEECQRSYGGHRVYHSKLHTTGKNTQRLWAGSLEELLVPS